MSQPNSPTIRLAPKRYECRRAVRLSASRYVLGALLSLGATAAFTFSGPIPGTYRPDKASDIQTVDQLMARVSQGQVLYAQQLSLVVGIEHYTQRSNWFLRENTRTMISEFVLVRVHGDWLGLRDIHEVDGKAVSDHQQRLQSIFLSGSESALQRARRINDESSRNNLGPLQRNFNVPTMALLFLQQDYARRFRFRKSGDDQIDGILTWKVSYQELKTPTIIRTPAGKDMPVRGTFWINPRTAEVLKTHMQLSSGVSFSRQEGQDMRAVMERVPSSVSVTVKYAPHTDIGLLLPVEMVEAYETLARNPLTGNEELSRVTCRATYSHFKRFQTSGRVLTK